MSFEDFRRLVQQQMKYAKKNALKGVKKQTTKPISTAQAQPLKGATPQKGGCCGKPRKS